MSDSIHWEIPKEVYESETKRFIGVYNHVSMPSLILTKREYFAGLAMQGMLAEDHWRGGSQSGKSRKDLVEYCVSYSDLLIAELAKEQSKC